MGHCLEPDYINNRMLVVDKFIRATITFSVSMRAHCMYTIVETIEPMILQSERNNITIDS